MTWLINQWRLKTKSRLFYCWNHTVPVRCGFRLGCSRWGHIGATWRILLNRRFAAAMRPCVRLLWPLVNVRFLRQFCVAKIGKWKIFDPTQCNPTFGLTQPVFISCAGDSMGCDSLTSGTKNNRSFGYLLVCIIALLDYWLCFYM